MNQKNALSIIFVVFSLIVGIFLAGNNIRARFGPIDDHEIVSWLGPDKRISLREFPEIIRQTELSKFGDYARYRPSYYLMRIVETYLWGGEAGLWYLARVVMFVTAIYLTLQILSIYVWWPVAVFGVLHILSQNYWGDILSRLGPSEIYAVLGLPMFTFGIINIWRKTAKKHTFLMYFVGFVLCVGSKENFSFLIIPTLIMTSKLIYDKQMNSSRLLASVAMIGYTTLIFSSIAINTLKTSSDIYGTDISVIDRLRLFLDITWRMLDGFVTKQMVFGLILIFILIVGVFSRKRILQLIKTSMKYLGIVLAIGLVGATQYIYYGAIFPTTIRYDFPLLVIPTILIIILTKYLVAVLTDLGFKYGKPLVYLGVLLIFALLIKPNNFLKTRAKSIQNVEMTSNFMGKLMKDSELMMVNHKAPLIINSERPIDYEMISSLRIFLHYLGVSNSIHLRYISNPDLRDSVLGLLLDERLRAVSDQGNSDFIKGYTAYGDQLTNRECYAIMIGEVENESECVPLSRY